MPAIPTVRLSDRFSLQPLSTAAMFTSGHTRPNRSSRPSSLPMSPSELVGSLRGRTGSSAVPMTCTLRQDHEKRGMIGTHADDGWRSQIRVHNYNTSEKITSFEAHPDYIRAIAVHPTQPFVLTASDDMTIKLWDWEKGWKNVRVFEGNSRMLERDYELYGWRLTVCDRLRNVPSHQPQGYKHIRFGMFRQDRYASPAPPLIFASNPPTSQDLEPWIVHAQFPARSPRDEGCEPRRLLPPQRQALSPNHIRRCKDASILQYPKPVANWNL